MLHLFNSCYVYPYILLDPTQSYLVVGENYVEYQTVSNSFFYNNSSPREPFERLESFEKFASSNWLEPAVNNKDRFIIYTDNDNFVKFFTAKMKTQVANLSEEFFLTTAKLFAVKLRTRAKLLNTDDAKEQLNSLADALIALDKIPDVPAFTLPRSWVTANAGIEWKIANGIFDNVHDIINRNVYSYFDEARALYLSRKEGGWAVEETNQKYKTCSSVEDLYMEMRKEIMVFTDSLILQYYYDREMFKDPKFLLLLASNKDMGDKIDLWLIRWIMKMSQEQIKELDIVA